MNWKLNNEIRELQLTIANRGYATTVMVREKSGKREFRMSDCGLRIWELNEMKIRGQRSEAGKSSRQ